MNYLHNQMVYKLVQVWSGKLIYFDDQVVVQDKSNQNENRNMLVSWDDWDLKLGVMQSVFDYHGLDLI
jgi:hypothetical protein